MIERRAVEHWRRLGLKPGFDIEAMVDDLDLGILWEPIEPVDGREVAAELKPARRRILVNEALRGFLDANAGFYRFTLAHEVGHWDLHSEDVRAGSDALLDDDSEPTFCRLAFGRDRAPTGLESLGEARREHQANLFATYLLAPTDIFKAAFRETGCDGWRATLALAERLELSGQATLVRLEEERLAHRDARGIPRPGLRPEPGQGSLGL